MGLGKWLLVYLLIFLFLSFIPLVGTLLIRWVLKGKIKNRKIMALANFLIFFSLFIMEIFLLAPVYLKKGLRGRMADQNDQDIGERFDPVYVPPLNFSTRRYEPYYQKEQENPVNSNQYYAEKEKRIQELEKLRSENKISEEVFNKAKKDLLGE